VDLSEPEPGPDFDLSAAGGAGGGEMESRSLVPADSVRAAAASQVRAAAA
jgi:hypothetical protein